MSDRTLSDAPLQISPELRGALLASPLRRGIAFGIDLALILIPSIAVSLGAAILTLRFEDPRAMEGLRKLVSDNSRDEQARREVFDDILPLLARHEAPGLPAAARAAIEEGNLKEAFELLRDYNFQFDLQVGEFEPPPVPPKTIRIQTGEFIPKSVRFMALYGVAAVYFTLFSSGRRGATIGKRLTGIRVARLDGHKLSLSESLERFVGYLHIPATLGLPILDLWRDPNRRLPHDRSAHTAVLRVIRRKAPGK